MLDARLTKKSIVEYTSNKLKSELLYQLPFTTAYKYEITGKKLTKDMHDFYTEKSLTNEETNHFMNELTQYYYIVNPS